MTQFRLVIPVTILSIVFLLVAACAPAATPTTPTQPAETTPAPAATSPAQPEASPAAQPTTGTTTEVQVPPPPSPKPEQLDKVTYGIVSYNPFHWIAMIAQQKKTMEPYGIEFDLVLTRSAPSAMSALAGGSLDLATSTPGASWDVQQKSEGFKQVMEIVTGNPYSIITQPDIKSFSDIKGKTIAGQSLTSGADIETLRLLLEENGLEFEKDYNILAIGSVAERQAALMANQVAAVSMLPPNTFELQENGKNTLAQAWDYPFFKDVTTVNVLARTDWYTDNPDVAKRFMQGYAATVAWIYDPANREEAIAILADLMKMDPKYAEQTYEQFVIDMQVFPRNPAIKEQNLKQAYDNLERLGKEVPPDPMSLVDNSVVEGALQ